MRDRIAEVIERLSPSERRVAELVVADPEAVMGATVAQLAKSAGVSEPTVMRFCRSLGLEGFAELRLALARAEAAPTPRPHRRHVLPGMAPAQAVPIVLDSTIAALEGLRTSLDAVAIERAALALVRASRVEVWGFGASAAVADGIAQRLLRTCRSVVTRADPQLQAMAAATLDGDSAALCVSLGGMSRELVSSAHLARASGATVIALTRAGSALAAAATLVLPCPLEEDPAPHAPMSARIAQLVLGDALAVTAALLSPPAAAERAARMNAALKPHRMEG